MRPLPRVRSTLRTVLVTGTTVATAAVVLSAPAQAAPASSTAATNAAVAAGEQVTPGDFTGYGFDQCVTPTQHKMNKWMEYSPFAAVGIYTSGYSRACRDQPNLTKRWVSKQLANNWRLLPITLGPQASCQPRFPRYGNDATISPRTRNNYGKARRQARVTAKEAVAAAQNLGIGSGSTLWYDLEGFDLGNTSCRESALRFLHAWTNKIHQLGYVSGVYSSAGSGIKMLDDARINRPGKFALPDAIWIARWDGIANTSTSYISEYGWQPHKRVKQYRGGHNETWGGVTINIDSNYMSLGKGSTMPRAGRSCGNVNINIARFKEITPENATDRVLAIRALQCQLKTRGYYKAKVNGKYTATTIAAANAFQRDHGVKARKQWRVRHWVMLTSAGHQRTVKRGFTGRVMRRLQRSLAAASGKRLPVTGVFDARTESIAKTWQARVGLRQSGVINTDAWARLNDGQY